MLFVVYSVHIHVHVVYRVLQSHMYVCRYSCNAMELHPTINIQEERWTFSPYMYSHITKKLMVPFTEHAGHILLSPECLDIIGNYYNVLLHKIIIISCAPAA